MCECEEEEVRGVASHDAALPPPAAGRSDPADPVLPRLPQDPEPADVPQPGRPLGAHKPAPPHGGGEEAQTQLLTSGEPRRSKHPLHPEVWRRRVPPVFSPVPPAEVS